MSLFLRFVLDSATLGAQSCFLPLVQESVYVSLGDRSYFPELKSKSLDSGQVLNQFHSQVRLLQ